MSVYNATGTLFFMKPAPLPTYLRTYRKRSGLTHEEIAFLCGTMSGTSFTRHESAKRMPSLRKAVMYELVLRAPIRDLYEGVACDVAATVEKRVLGMCASYEKKPVTKARARKIAHLKAILEDLSALRP